MNKMTGSRFVAEAIRGYGITHVFFVPAVFLDALAEIDDVGGIQCVSCHSELAAAYMADGYARARRTPSVCFAQAVGAANLAAGLRDAYLGTSPVVALTGGPEFDYRHRHVYQEIEDLPMYDAVTKWNVRVEKIERLPDLWRQALRVATTGAPGPVHLEVPGRLGQGLDASGDLQVVVEERFSRVPPYRLAPEPDAVTRAAEMLAVAERPVIVAGRSVIASDAGAELVELAERLSIPMALSLNAKDVITEHHPLNLGIVGTYGRWSTNRIMNEADLVFFAGSQAGGHVTDFWRAPRPGVRVIQMDVDPEEVGRNYSLMVGLVGDAKLTLQGLIDATEPYASATPWAEYTQQLTGQWRAETAPRIHSEAAPMLPERVCHEVGRALPPDGVVVSDTGHSAIWSSNYVELDEPGQRYIRCEGTLGWAVPGAMGIKCALPNAAVVCVTGDGGLYYHISELETAVRNGIHTITIVLNNGSFRQTKGDFHGAFKERAARSKDMWVFRDTDFVHIAESFGAIGMRAENPTQLRRALQDALEADRPVLIDAVCDIAAQPLGAWAAQPETSGHGGEA